MPKNFISAHLRKLPAVLGEGQSVTSTHFDGDSDFDNEYGVEHTLRTVCRGGRLYTECGEETLD